jgi:hypothetical protein
MCHKKEKHKLIIHSRNFTGYYFKITQTCSPAVEAVVLARDEEHEETLSHQCRCIVMTVKPFQSDSPP